jgi:hypothetical protein
MPGANARSRQIARLSESDRSASSISPRASAAVPRPMRLRASFSMLPNERK